MELLGSIQFDGTDTINGVEENVIGIIMRICFFWCSRMRGHLESISVP